VPAGQAVYNGLAWRSTLCLERWSLGRSRAFGRGSIANRALAGQSGPKADHAEREVYSTGTFKALAFEPDIRGTPRQSLTSTCAIPSAGAPTGCAQIKVAFRSARLRSPKSEVRERTLSPRAKADRLGPPSGE
jgi:hypothetical protein